MPDPRFAELDALIAAIPRRRPGPHGPWAARKRERIEAEAARMRARYGPHQGVVWDHEHNCRKLPGECRVVAMV
jgi:hypothetical protein